jgi:hypothetical protein
MAHSERGQGHARVRFGGGDIGREILSYLIALETGAGYNRQMAMSVEDAEVFLGTKIGVICKGDVCTDVQEEAQYESLLSHVGACRLAYAP